MQYVPTTGPNLSDWLEAGNPDVSGLPGVTATTPTDEPTEYDMKEAAANAYIKAKNAKPQHTPYLTFGNRMPTPPTPGTPPPLPDVRQDTLNLARFIPLLSLFGGPRAIGAIAPGAFQGIAESADQDYARRYQAYALGEKAQQQAYNSQLDLWKLGSEDTRYSNQAIGADNRSADDVYQSGLRAAGAILADRTNAWKEGQKDVTNRINKLLSFLATGSQDFQQVKQAYENINQLQAYATKHFHGPDVSMFDLTGQTGANIFNRMEALRQTLGNKELTMDMYTKALRDVAGIQTTSAERREQWRLAVERARLAAEKATQANDFEIRKMGILHSDLRTAAQLEADINKFATETAEKNRTWTQQEWLQQHGAESAILAREIDQRNKLMERITSDAKALSDPLADPTDADVARIQQAKLEVDMLSVSIRNHTNSLVDSVNTSPSGRKIAPPSLPSTFNRLVPGNQGAQPASPQTKRGGDAGGRHLGATPPARATTNRSSSTRGREVSPGRPGNVRSVRPDRQTPAEKAELDSLR